MQFSLGGDLGMKNLAAGSPSPVPITCDIGAGLGREAPRHGVSFGIRPQHGSRTMPDCALGRHTEYFQEQILVALQVRHRHGPC